MNYKQLSEKRLCNAMAMVAYSMLTAILVICYFIEVVKGSRTIGYFTVFSILALVPVIICWICAAKDKENSSIKYIMSCGFWIFCTFIIFTTTSSLAYIYAPVFAIILMCFNNVKLSTIYMISVTLSNIVLVIYKGITHQITKEALPDIEIQIASLILLTLFMYCSTTIVKCNTDRRMNEIEEEKNRTAALMNQILQASEQLTSNISNVSEKMEILENTTQKTMVSMEEVAQGTNDTSESIQLQLEKTGEIQNSISAVENASRAIASNIEETQNELISSQGNIDQLIKHVNISNEANANVSRELETLNTYTDQMQSIIEMINGVTTQTSLLSLNASIEAARAGEAGRGFAVVASEISNLATQTQQATVDITSLINSISSELSQVINVIEQMIKNAEEQNIAANNTAKSFAEITNRTNQIAQQAGQMNHLVSDLTEANSVIAKGIETISAATEEVTAHSNETLESTSENNQITDEVSSIIEKLNQMAQDLMDMTK